MVSIDILFLISFYIFWLKKVVKGSSYWTNATLVPNCSICESTKIRFRQKQVFFTKSTTSVLPTISTCWRSMAVFIVLADQISSLLCLFHAEPNPSAAVSLVKFVKGGSKIRLFFFNFYFLTIVGWFPNFTKLTWQVQTRKCFHLSHLKNSNKKKKTILNFSPTVFNLDFH